MSYVQRTFASLRANTSRVSNLGSSSKQAFFSTTRVRAALSENDKDHPERSANIDKHKHDSVNKAKEGQGEWKPELASSSEQAVQGEKTNLSMDEMQKLGEKQAQQGKQPSGSSSNKV